MHPESGHDEYSCGLLFLPIGGHHDGSHIAQKSLNFCITVL